MATTFRTLRDVFGRTAPKMEQLAADQQDFLRDAANMEGSRTNGYKIYEDAYDGERRSRYELSLRQREYLEASGIPFAENFCQTIVDTHKRRLRVRGFDVEDREDVSGWLTKDFWRRGRLAALAGVVHGKSLSLGDAALIVDWDRATGRPKPFFNHPRNIKFVYGDNGLLLYVPKVWNTRKTSPQNPRGESIRRLNLYYPDRVAKWYTASNSSRSLWVPYVDPDDSEDGVPLWPLPWTVTGRIGGEPLGIPAVHFRNNALGDDYGRSMLRPVIPLNDELEKQVLDLFQVMDTQGWKQRWAAGIKPDDKLTVEVGEWVTSQDDKARFGEFPAEDPGPLLEVLEGTIRRMSVVSATPLHDLLILNGSQPSGESRKDASTPLVAATEDRWEDAGNSWEDFARIAWRMSAAWGRGDHQAPAFDDTAVIDVQWEPAETRNDRDEVETLALEVEMLGLSRTTALRKRGHDPDEEAALRARERDDAPLPPPPDGPAVVPDALRQPQPPQPAPAGQPTAA